MEFFEGYTPLRPADPFRSCYHLLTLHHKALIFWIVFWVIGILIGSIAGFILYGSVQSARKFKQAKRVAASRIEPVYIPTPFYFPFKERGTSMFTTLPFSEDKNFQARHNSQGFRTPEYTTGHPPNTFRILLLGDSCTWGQGVKTEETFWYVAANLLRKHCSRFDFEAIGAGVCGHRMADHLIKLLVHAPALKPDLVVIQVFANDVDFYDYLSIYQFQNLPDPVGAYTMKLREIYRPGTIDRNVFSESLLHIRTWSEKTGTPVTFLVFPPVSMDPSTRNMNHYDPKAYEGLVQFTDFEKVINEIRDSFPTLYLIETFREKAGDTYLAVSEKDAHPNAFAHQLAGEALVEFLTNRSRIVDCSLFRPQPEDTGWKEEKKLRDQAEKQWDRFHLNYAKQAVLYKKLKVLYPQNAWITMQLGIAYNKLGKWKESYETYNSLSQLAPEISAPWFHMAENRPEKRPLLEKMRAYVPDHASTLNDLSQYYLNQNNRQDACPLLQQLVRFPQSIVEYKRAKRLYDKHCSSF